MDYKLYKPSRTTRSLLPENQESPILHLEPEPFDDAFFFVRNHFDYPDVSGEMQIILSGRVHKPSTFTLTSLKQMPFKSVDIVLECAGNKRSFFDPKVFGEQWENGAMSRGRWQGVPLVHVLEEAGLMADALEVVFEGYDRGEKEDIDQVVPYKRSLPLEKALHPDTLIAYSYNDQPIPFKHGYPFRLIVPGWYAMASVKWLKSIEVINHHFEGPFQTLDYVYYPADNSEHKPFPVTTMQVNSIIQYPLDYAIIDRGVHRVNGLAWTGTGLVSRVEYSLDLGDSWQEAAMEKENSSKYLWMNWHFLWPVHTKGEYTLLVRAHDSTGNTQPIKPFWNKKGYGYNAVAKVNVKVV